MDRVKTRSYSLWKVCFILPTTSVVECVEDAELAARTFSGEVRVGFHREEGGQRRD